MIISIKHKGLRKFAETGKTSGIPQQLSQRLKLILTALSTATTLQDMMDLKALRCHPLKGDRQGEYSLEVNGNWRVVFKLEEPNVFDVDLEDYH
ncbi:MULTISPECIES: type II toxin-antitoxin system RelE/ParE family toxin [Enterobacteriaceae]|uniref:Killer protein n=1 Tax=Escherichia coli TaxID=562 RepID=A0A6N8R162_ECOLX|nr:type II toxin-antitoxin system RelE/ParE family toxin [Citrobacter freundii]MDH8356746.1 type II toxin-antitoxin system RelE/ParE family toxin [Klebsiella pneumoniae]MXI76054.1 Killer protein [Escherichia coli]MXJ78421.1 Killer protein [Escherichia coli]HBX5699397.1 Killer protein [Klebsiella pneumoniae]HCA9787497.1 type II toxin-antitoxin system RelE/ParE family toxin [Klebsiella pneumoniae]